MAKRGRKKRDRKHSRPTTASDPTPDEARNARLRTEAGFRRFDVADQRRMIVVRLISMRSRSTQACGAFSPLHLVAISRLTRSSTP